MIKFKITKRERIRERGKQITILITQNLNHSQLKKRVGVKLKDQEGEGGG